MFNRKSFLVNAAPVALEDLIVLGVHERCISDIVDEFEPLLLPLFDDERPDLI